MTRQDKRPPVDQDPIDTDERRRARESQVNLKHPVNTHYQLNKLAQSKPLDVMQNIMKRQLTNKMLEIQATVAFISKIIFQQKLNKTDQPRIPGQGSSKPGRLASLKTEIRQIQNLNTSDQKQPEVTQRPKPKSESKLLDQSKRAQLRVQILAPLIVLIKLLSSLRDKMQALVKLEKNQVVKNLAAELKKQMDNTPLAKKNPQTPLANSATTTRKPTLTLK